MCNPTKVLGNAVGAVGDAVGNFADNPIRGISTVLNPLSTVLPSNVNQLLGTGLNFVEPGLGTAYSATGSLANGGSVGNAAKNAAISFGTQQLGSALGNYFPDTFGRILGSNGGTLTDALGNTSGAGSLSNYYSSIPGIGSNGLQTGTGLTAGSSNAPLYNVGGGGQSSFGSSSDVPSLKLNGDYSGNSLPSSALDASYSSPSSSSSIGKLLGSAALPLAGAGASLLSNQAAQDQLKKATNSANAQLSPYLQNGSSASNAAADYLGLGGTDGTGKTSADILAASPGYQFQLDQGNRALTAQQAASGSINSGAAQKAALKFGQGLANQIGQQYLSNLQSTAGTGLGAAGQYGNNTTALGSAGANANIASGNTLAQLLASGTGKRVTGYGANGPIYGSY